VTIVTLRVPGTPGGVEGEGAGGGVDGAVTAKLSVPDVPPPGVGVNTVTGTDFDVAKSVAVRAARS
jgi:hypothetical protein